MNMEENDIRTLLGQKYDDERLGIIEKKLISLLNTDAVVDAHRKQVSDLEQIEEAVEGITKAFDPAVHEREPLEHAYAAKIDMLLGMSRRFHPLSAYGIEMLTKAMECRKDFEEIAGPFVTRITAENVEKFDSVLIPDLAEDVSTGKSYGIGALRSRGNDVYGVGAAVFDINKISTTGEDVLRLRWLYVDEEWRETGVANSLIGELVCFMAREGLQAMTVDLYVDDYIEILGNLFAEWHFRFADGITPEFVFRLGDVKNRKSLEKYEDKATPLVELGEDEEKILIRDYMSKDGYRGYLAENGLPEDYIESELSCFAGTQSRPDGLTLVHQYPSGKLSVEYAKSRDENESCMEEMIGELAIMASYGFDRSTEIEIEEDKLEDPELLDEMFQKQRAQYLIEGILTVPYESLNSEGVAEFTGIGKAAADVRS